MTGLEDVTNDGEREQAAAADPVMKALHPDQLWVIRIRLGIGLMFLLCVILLAEWLFAGGSAILPGLVSALMIAPALLALLILPGRRYRAWAWREEEDELHIRHGVWIQVDVVVPFGRVQHIDVAQGPIERRFGLARLILHTAGTRSAHIPLPGLVHSEAERMRDRIRAKIRQDLL